LNFADIFCVLGLYSAANKLYGKDDAFVPGLEFSGVVVKDPTGTFERGESVLGFTRFGAYSDIVQVPVDYLWPLPCKDCDGRTPWSFIEGASVLVQALTAWHGLVEIGGMPNLEGRKCVELEVLERPVPYIVLIHSAAGGVGLWASEIAARRGATVIGVVGSAEKDAIFRKRIQPLSPNSTTILRGDEKTFGKRLQDLLKEVGNDHENVGADLVMESLGGNYFKASYESLRHGGSLVTFGSTSYVSPGLGRNPLRLIWRFLHRPKVDPGELTARNIRLAGFNLIYLTDQPRQLRRELSECIRCLGGEGKADLSLATPPIVGKTFDFKTGTIQALEYLKSGQTFGKVVLDNSENNAE
jgi:alcohol dehydrogenase